MKAIVAAPSLATLCGLSALLVAGGLHAEPLSRPSYAKPGECYARVVKPAVYGSETTQVLDTAAYSETHVIPAVTERVERQVVVTPERVERSWHEPVYREETHWVTRPGPKQLVQEPPRYETVKEKVLVEAGRYEWQRSFAPIARSDPRYGQTLVYATGEIYCRVWIEPRYSVVEKTVMVSPGRSYEVDGPTVQEKVVDRVLVSEGGWTEHREAAVYRTESEVRVIQAERVVTIPHPAHYHAETHQTVLAGEHEEWVRIDCAEKASAPPPPPPPVRAPYGERG